MRPRAGGASRDAGSSILDLLIEKSIKIWTINLAEAAPTPPEQPGVGARPAKNLYDFYLFCL
jgi:hypothetical protein